MAVTAYWYGKGALKLANKEIDWDTDTVKVMLTTSSYTPDKDAHDYKDDVTNEVTGTGYTAGGATLSSKTITYTAANSFTTTWAASTAYTTGDVVRPTTGNGHLYRCIVAGTSGGTEPSWPTVSGDTVTDGTVKWAECGFGIVQYDAADTVWSTSTITARYAVIYVSTGTDSTSPLLAYVDFGENKSSSGDNFTIQWDSQGILFVAVG